VRRRAPQRYPYEGRIPLVWEEGESSGSRRKYQALVATMPRTVLTRLTLLSILVVTVMFAGSASVGPI
jgi:hypothetical protein